MKKSDRKALQRIFDTIANGEELSVESLEVIRFLTLGKDPDPDKWNMCNTWFWGGGHLPSIEHSKRIIAALKGHIRQFEHEPELLAASNTWFMHNRQETFKPTAPYVEKPRRHREGFVYAMRNNRNGFTKIGYSRKPKYREETLQSQEPEVELLFFGPGTIDDEASYHDLFSTKRIRGEWFDLGVNEIATLRMALTGTSV